MSTESHPLIRTKLNRPLLSAGVVQRPRLIDQLNRDLTSPLTLVCAAAGFGKTTLVSSWIETMTKREVMGAAFPRSAWLSLDASDSDPVVFLRYFIAALRTLFPDACGGTLTLVQAQQQPPLEALAAALCNEIDLLPEAFILVLDDYASLHGAAVPDLLTTLLHYWPRPLHLVLISRHNPPLPLADLRAKGRITEIRSRDLRFTSEETAEYLDQALPMPLSQSATTLLEQRTEGWIAGLYLACLSLRQTDDVEALLMGLANPGTHIADFLVDEVLAQQPPEIQSFLLKTSILNQFCASACEAIIGNGDPGWDVLTCMNWLEHGELFIIPLDNRQEWYRYHSLFRDLLQQRLLARLGLRQVNDLQRKAATWFAQLGVTDAALQHALVANDLDLAAQLMEDGLRDVLNREDRPTLERWLHLLPEELIQRRPGLLSIKVWALQLSWQINAQLATLDQMEWLMAQNGGGAWDGDSLSLWRGQILTLRAQEAYFHLEPTVTVDLCREALALLPATWTYCRGGAMIYLGLGMQASGQGQAAERLLLDAYALLDDKINAYSLRLMLPLCFIYLHSGQLEQVRQTAQTLLTQATRGGLVILQGWAHYFLGHVHYLWNELEIARQHFDAVAANHHRNQVLPWRDSMVGLALTDQARGEYARARQTLEILSQDDLEQSGNEWASTRSLRARLMLLQGEAETAWRWADAFTAPVQEQPLLWLEEPQLTRARILLARGADADLKSSLQILRTLLAIAERTFNIRHQIELLALLALALQAQGAAAEALAIVQQAVEISHPASFTRIFLDLGQDIRRLLEQLAQLGLAANSVHLLLNAFPDRVRGSDQEVRLIEDVQQAKHESGQSPLVPVLAEPLTRREIEILALMQTSLSGKEMARKLGISNSTIKRHIANIYGKLGVNKRRQAVSRAEALGIRPPR